MLNEQQRMKDARNKQNDFRKLLVRGLPVNDVKVFLKVSWVNVGFAELQLSPRVVVNVVDTHFLHDAKTSLRR